MLVLLANFAQQLVLLSPLSVLSFTPPFWPPHVIPAPEPESNRRSPPRRNLPGRGRKSGPAGCKPPKTPMPNVFPGPLPASPAYGFWMVFMFTGLSGYTL